MTDQEFYIYEQQQYATLFTQRISNSGARRLLRKMRQVFGVKLPFGISFEATEWAICESDPMGHEFELPAEPTLGLLGHEFAHALHFEQMPNRSLHYHNKDYKKVHAEVFAWLRNQKEVR